MVKTSSNRTKAKAPPPKRAKMNNGMKRVVATLPRQPGLNMAELAHARQLIDPCEAPLAPPVYGGSEGSAIVRVKGITAYNSGPTGNQPYGVVYYHPTFGAYSMTGLVAGGTLGVDYDLYPVPTTYPTRTATRAIAGCLKVRFLGSELNRSGKVALGIVPGSFVWEQLKQSNGGAGFPFTNDQVFASLEHSARMPVDGAEIVWQPGAIDAEFYEATTAPPIQSNTLEGLLARTNFVAVAWQGIGTDTCPIEIEVTSVVERYFAFSSTTAGGLYVVSAGKRAAGGQESISRVIRYLQNKDSKWYINAAMKASRLLNLGYSAMRGDLIGMVGAMGIGTNRNLRQITSG
jgi:hypothetical protein